ncbi:hypothetical protein [Streptomyces sp. NPDC057686]|uniref:hypothetical protein n=1 Tax=Streptomyces sp. NPDC057686 TaxID=3346212 RepID=UPI00368073CE
MVHEGFDEQDGEARDRADQQGGGTAGRERAEAGDADDDRPQEGQRARADHHGEGAGPEGRASESRTAAA